jgi:hypothetical protein
MERKKSDEEAKKRQRKGFGRKSVSWSQRRGLKSGGVINSHSATKS